MPNDIAINPRAVIGGNAPPPSPFEIAEKAVNDIYSETVLWLDGHQIDSQELADGVANLLASIRKAEKQADDARVAEKAQHDEAIKEIQSRYAPLIGDTKATKGKTVLAVAACKQALQPWLAAEDARIREEARIAREEADRQRHKAEEVLRASTAANLAERAAAEELLSAAKRAETVANVAERQTAKAGGTFGRSASLRAVWVTTITDETQAARTAWLMGRAEMLDYLLQWGEQQVRLGRRELPGFKIEEKKVAV